jgi:3-hydroxymyristoyl/3-hydroxydecanoyl-(acyl carrier protein) dehydratase
MECQVMALRKRFGIAKCRGRGYVDGELAFEADMTFACNK